MIITRTPLRISIGGGGTDLPSYYKRFGGFVISAAINKYIYITISRAFRPGYFLKYATLESADTPEEIQHPLIRECLRQHRIAPNVEIVSIADIPAGTGLGSSGTFSVGLLHALHAYKRHPVTPELLAREACDIEMNVLGEPCGKQDPYIGAYGGILCQDYHPNGGVNVKPLAIDDATVRELRENLMLFFTGYTRSAAAPLEEQRDQTEAGDADMLENLHFIKGLGLRIEKALESGDTQAFGELMHEHWLHKKVRSPSISNSHINELYDYARDNGAVGGKLVGAGGGGFLLFYTGDRGTLRRAMATTGLEELDFSFDFDGSVVLLRN